LRAVHRFETKPVWPVSPRLKPHLRKARFGLEMYRTLAESRVTLNIHADSSPTHASNMRLFETTGVGSCLLTDWKSNLTELFEPDKEIIVYRSAGECIDKACWLLDHPQDCRQVAAAGQKRTLRDHTFAARAPQFDEIIYTALRRASRR
jgi:spore maturation protein CgeB